jgi:hypothetical protein
MPVNEPLNYEVAVFRDDVQAIAELVLAEVAQRLGPIDGEKMKVCIVAAALMTAADLLDYPGADAIVSETGRLPVFKDDGVTGALARMVASRVVRR